VGICRTYSLAENNINLETPRGNRHSSATLTVSPHTHAAGLFELVVVHRAQHPEFYRGRGAPEVNPRLCSGKGKAQ